MLIISAWCCNGLDEEAALDVISWRSQKDSKLLKLINPRVVFPYESIEKLLSFFFNVSYFDKQFSSPIFSYPKHPACVNNVTFDCRFSTSRQTLTWIPDSFFSRFVSQQYGFIGVIVSFNLYLTDDFKVDCMEQNTRDILCSKTRGVHLWVCYLCRKTIRQNYKLHW